MGNKIDEYKKKIKCKESCSFLRDSRGFLRFILFSCFCIWDESLQEFQ